MQQLSFLDPAINRQGSVSHISQHVYVSSVYRGNVLELGFLEVLSEFGGRALSGVIAFFVQRYGRLEYRMLKDNKIFADPERV